MGSGHRKDRERGRRDGPRREDETRRATGLREPGCERISGDLHEMSHADHCDTSTTSNPDHTNTCYDFNNYADAWQDCAGHSDSSPELCPGAFQGDFHVDNDCHNDVSHSDVTHSNTHSNVAAWNDHYDSHSDTHGDTHSDSHTDYHSHNCNGAFYVNYTAEPGQVWATCVWLHWHGCAYGECEFEDCGGVGYDHYDWTVYQRHQNSYSDVAHSDSHSDTHSNIAHADEWYNVVHSDTHSDVAFVDVAFSNHCDHVDHNAG